MVILIVGVLGFNESIKCANINAELEDSSVNTHEDILIFREFKKVVLARAEAEKSDCIGEKVVAMKECDSKIINLSKRIKSTNN